MKYFTLAILPFITGCALMSGNRSAEYDEEAIAEAQAAERLRIHTAMETRDVTLGMKPNQVRSAWGETLKALKALYILFFLIKLKTLEAI